MKNLLLKSIIILTIGLFFINFSGKKITCIIRGKVTGRNSDTIFLKKATEDVRFARIMIPIKDSLFEYKLVIPQIEAYELIFMDELKKGAWHPILFFPEEGEIKCILYPASEAKKNMIIGGVLNSEYQQYQKEFEETFMPKYQPFEDSLNVLKRTNEYYNPEMTSLMEDRKKASNAEERSKIDRKINDLRSSGNYLSEKAKAINEKVDMFSEEAFRWRYNYIEQNPSILTYYFLFHDLQYKYKINIDDFKNRYDLFSKKYSSHPYTQLIKDLLKSRENLIPGGSFIDFSAPDLNGKIVKVSDVIKDKIALIDLWASWCGPCIVTSRSMIPVYNEFKDKGFTVCGVASENKNTDQMKRRIEIEKFPWINLVDLDQKNQIWYKYGIPNAGGGTFLVDRDGKILAVNPTAEEVRNILTEKLK